MSRKLFYPRFQLRPGGAGEARSGASLQRFQPIPLRGQGAKPSNLRAQSETRPETPNHEPQSARAPQTPNPNPQTRKREAKKIRDTSREAGAPDGRNRKAEKTRGSRRKIQRTRADKARKSEKRTLQNEVAEHRAQAPNGTRDGRAATRRERDFTLGNKSKTRRERIDTPHLPMVYLIFKLRPRILMVVFI